MHYIKLTLQRLGYLGFILSYTIVGLLALCLPGLAQNDNRLLVAHSLSGNVIALYSCAHDWQPVVDPTSPVQALCFVQCFGTLCISYEMGPMSFAPLDNAASLAIVTSQNSNDMALMYSSDSGLHIWLCQNLKCLDGQHQVIRPKSDFPDGKWIGNALAYGINNSMIFAFIERNETSNIYQAVLGTCSRDNFCTKPNITVLTNWTSDANISVSPIFLKRDHYGRFIVGFQSVIGVSPILQLWRCYNLNSCERMSNLSMDTPIASLSVQPAELTNYGVVMAGGTKLSMFNYISGISDGIAPEPTPATSAPSSSTVAAAVTIPPSTKSTSPDTPIEIPEGPITVAEPEGELAETEPNNSADSYSISDDANSNGSAYGEDTPDTPSTSPNVTANSWYITDLNEIGGITGSTLGFQAGMVLVPGLTPVFTFSYVQSGAWSRYSRGYCENPSCKGQISISIVQSYYVSSSGATQPAMVAPIMMGDEHLLILAHIPGGRLRRTVYRPYTSASTIVDSYLNTIQLKPYAVTPQSDGFGILGIVVVTTATIAALIIVISLTVFLLHIVPFRRHQDEPLWDAQLLSNRQITALTAYYKALQED